MRKFLIYAIFVVIAQILICNEAMAKKPQKEGTFIGKYEYVDLGLSVKWATCNIGAKKPGQYGDYFAWGETSKKGYYYTTNYKHCFSYDWNTPEDRSEAKYIKYTKKDGLMILEEQDDAATVKWGKPWRMPTRKESEELIENCECEVAKENGKNGLRLTSKINGNSIFFPFCGQKFSTSSELYGKEGYYWTSNILPNYIQGALVFVAVGSILAGHALPRYAGAMIRPVAE